jgi:Ca2+-binding RTX toxin-like protein
MVGMTALRAKIISILALLLCAVGAISFGVSSTLLDHSLDEFEKRADADQLTRVELAFNQEVSALVRNVVNRPVWDDAALHVRHIDETYMDKNFTTLSLDDVLFGQYGSQYTLIGGAGDDTLTVVANNPYYRPDNNSLEGGTGNETMSGSARRDTYRFNLGDGVDSITEGYADAGYSDRIVFGAGVAAVDIAVSRVGNDLVLSHRNGSDRVTVKNWFSSAAYQIETVEFADGTVWQAASTQKT